MQALKLRRVGNSVGLVLPKETLARLNVEAGDYVFLTDAPDGCRITPYDPEFDKQMTAARAIMKRRRSALRELAK